MLWVEDIGRTVAMIGGGAALMVIGGGAVLPAVALGGLRVLGFSALGPVAGESTSE